MFIGRIKQSVSVLIVMVLTALSMNAVAKSDVELKVDWPAFMSRHDLIWKQMPKEWYQAPFLGNGMMGTMVRQIDARTMRWDVGHGAVQDHRDAGDMYDRCRLPIGHFNLKTVGNITSGSMKLDLWNAEATGEVITDKGTIKWRSLVVSGRMIILAEIEATEGERECTWQWEAIPAMSPRKAFGRKKNGGYIENPPSHLEIEGDINLCVQPLLAGGETATAWKIANMGSQKRLLVSVGHSFPAITAKADAVKEVRSAAKLSTGDMLKMHRAWWHEYYPESFVSLPDSLWESHYWIQMYKLASATRSDGMLIDNQGPWLQPTPWPGAWWNLNVQLTYWSAYDSNRLKLGESLTRALYSNVDRLILNVPEKYRSDSAGIGRTSGQHCYSDTVQEPGKKGGRAAETGLLLWACHNCWLDYRHTMDDAQLREHLYPLLTRAVNYHLHFLKKGEDGKLHLPRTYSPEYNSASGPDCNFDLGLLRWGCQALIQAADRLGIDDPLLPKWKDVTGNLADYPTNENGYMIAAGVPFAKGHRHYSHLLMLYPLYMENAEVDGAEELAVKSVKHWQSLGARQGYSNTGASSISAAFGRGNDALQYLNGFKSFFQPNTLYKEAGPVIETPLSGAQCIHDMLIQSWGDKIRIFPAVADVWKDAVFHNLRTQGAFLVSAVRKHGQTQFVMIKSLAGEPCRVKPGFAVDAEVNNSKGLNLKESKPGIFDLPLKKGEEVVLWVGGTMPDLKIRPIATDKNKWNYFGMK